jgi:hypothetical protein
MPKGFNRLGPVDAKDFRLWIYESWEAATEHRGKAPGDLTVTGPFDLFNVPVWKYLDEHGNTLVRGMCPRTNRPFLHIILGDHLDKIDCLEITDEDLKGMD